MPLARATCALLLASLATATFAQTATLRPSPRTLSVTQRPADTSKNGGRSSVNRRAPSA